MILILHLPFMNAPASCLTTFCFTHTTISRVQNTRSLLLTTVASNRNGRRDTVCLTSQKYYINKCSLFLLKIIWAINMFKGSLLPKGGHLTRSLVEDRAILLFFSVGDLTQFLRSPSHFLTFGHSFRQTETFKG